MHPRILPLALIAATASNALAQAPVNLQITAATRSQVALKWDAISGATSYQLERRIESGAFAPVGAPVTQTTAVDTKIDVYATYTYHVKAIGAASAVSNEVIVGPPPAGFNYVQRTPENADGDFGVGLSMVLDANDDPIFAYMFRNPNRNGHNDESIILFGGWDRANHRWRKPRQLDVVGDFPDRQMPVSLARDTQTGQLALAWLHEDHSRHIAFSGDNGVTWKQQTVSSADGEFEAQSCTVALASGKIHLAYFAAGPPLYITGNVSDDPSKWTRSSAPAQDGFQFRPIGDLALDSSGNPALAYIGNLEAGGIAAQYWRPGSNPVKAADSLGIQNDDPGIFIAFAGSKPRMLFQASRDNVDTHNIWFVTSDDGASWAQPAIVPNDGNRAMQHPLSLAIGPNGNYAAVSVDNAGNMEGVKCGWPKISLSPDGRQWTTCSPNPADLTDRSLDAMAAFAGNARLYVAYRQVGPNQALVVWHEGDSKAAGLAVHK